MQMMLESYFNLHYYGYGKEEYLSDSDGYDTEPEVAKKQEPEEEVVNREFPFDDDIIYINLKGPRVRTGWDNLPMEVRFPKTYCNLNRTFNCATFP